MKSNEFDFLIVGSGFGGSVSAMRLAQKGYRVCILESGKRWKSQDFAKSNWQIRKYLWLPRLGCFGIQGIRWLKGVMVLHGRGVGGGSLVYANTLMKPPAEVFNKDWPSEVSWVAELKPAYEKAEKMLGVVTNPIMAQAERALQKLAVNMHCESSFHPTRVGVYFAPKDKEGIEVSDPYFSGLGPPRTGCIGCGGCMIGCRYGAKNTLDKNYLFFAESWSCQIFAETAAEKIIPTSTGFEIHSVSTTRFFRCKKIFKARHIILSAGVLGTVELLLKNKYVFKTLPLISSQLGNMVRTNGESLLGATSLKKDRDYSKGIAIGAAFHPNDHTKIEAVKYPAGSDFMRLLAVPLTPFGGRLTRPLKMLMALTKNFSQFCRLIWIKDWAQSTVILLVMQNIDQKMKLFLKNGKLKGQTEKDQAIPSFLPVAQQAAELLAEEIDGVAQNIISEVLFATPATAHILGGCPMGSNVETGVISTSHQVFNYPGLYVCDGSVIGANLGVNPSLTITALAERFSDQFPVCDAKLFSQRSLHGI